MTPPREAALLIARRSPRIARLLSTTISAAARITLNVVVRPSEADSMARDYLPKDAVEQLRRHRERRELRSLPGEYRDRGGISSTILDGVTRSTDRELGQQRAGIAAWFQRIQLRVRTWNARNEITEDLRSRADQYEQAIAENARVLSAINELTDDVLRRNEQALECAHLRQEYAARIKDVRLPLEMHEESIAALDAVIDYHLSLLLGNAVSSCEGRSTSVQIPMV